jgi:3-(3-hydroxy-phenyl)propionate hydroxylase
LPSSSLVCPSRGLRQLAGTLCPNPQLLDGQRLDDVLGSGFSLITTRRPAPSEEAALRQRGFLVLVARRGDVLAQWLRGGRATAALIRPDRTVMRAGRDVAALCGWASSIVDGRFGQTLRPAGRR